MIAKVMPMNVKNLHSGKHVRVFFFGGELKRFKDSNELCGPLIQIPYHIGDDFHVINIVCDKNMPADILWFQEDLSNGECSVSIGQDIKDLLMMKKRVEYPCEYGQIDLLAKIVGAIEVEEINAINRIISFYNKNNSKKWKKYLAPRLRGACFVIWHIAKKC